MPRACCRSESNFNFRGSRGLMAPRQRSMMKMNAKSRLGRQEAHSALAIENLFYLSQMVQVMAGDHPHHVGHALITTFLVHAVVFPQLARRGLQQRKVGLAKHAVDL